MCVPDIPEWKGIKKREEEETRQKLYLRWEMEKQERDFQNEATPFIKGQITLTERKLGKIADEI